MGIASFLANIVTHLRRKRHLPGLEPGRRRFLLGALQQFVQRFFFLLKFLLDELHGVRSVRCFRRLGDGSFRFRDGVLRLFDHLLRRVRFGHGYGVMHVV